MRVRGFFVVFNLRQFLNHVTPKSELHALGGVKHLHVFARYFF